MTRLDRLRERLHQRKRNRERKRRLRQSHRAKREASAVRRLRRRIRKLLARRGPTVMYDSVTISEIPGNAKAVAGYTGGAWPTFAKLKTYFPQARRLSIAISASEDAECLDCEPGDASPAEAPAWVKRQKARGIKHPVVYGSASTMPQILAELAAAGIDRHGVRVWTAHYGAGKHRCGPHTCGYLKSTTADATQWTSESHGRNLDESTLTSDFFA
jgi:hypothetical protein